MLKNLRKAQSFGEYTVTISLVLLAVMAMTYFIQRGFQARIRDTESYMADALQQDMKNIHLSRGGLPTKKANVAYEPYYQSKISDTEADAVDSVFFNGVAGRHGFEKKGSTRMNIFSQELPAQDF